VFKRASPSVVHITTSAVYQRFFSLDVLEIPKGTGSGFVWDDAGYIVTNYHVIHGAQSLMVTLADQSSWKARVVGVHPDKDIAVLWVNAPRDRLPAIPIGRSGDLLVGQKVFAIGNPFGLDQTLTTGVVSALGREIQSMTRRTIGDVIQTDAAINPGNSGGPLLDSAARLIGVNTAIFSPSGTSAGIGFAIPVDQVNRIVPQLIESGKVTRPGLGVDIAADRITQGLGLRGVLIVGVEPNGPADRVGLRPTRREPHGRVALGDVIIAIGDQRVQTVDDFLNALERHKPHDRVTVTILRDGRNMTTEVTLNEAG
jgi:S1-C subfamily serine protease